MALEFREIPLLCNFFVLSDISIKRTHKMIFTSCFKDNSLFPAESVGLTSFTHLYPPCQFENVILYQASSWTRISSNDSFTDILTCF